MASGKTDLTEPLRRLAMLTADAILRHVETGEWHYVEILARSLLRTAIEARAVPRREADSREKGPLEVTR